MWDSGFTLVSLCVGDFERDMWKREIRVEKGKIPSSNRFCGASVRRGCFMTIFKQTWLWVRAHHWVLARVGRSPGRGGFALRRPSMALLGHAVGREGGSAGNEGNSASA